MPVSVWPGHAAPVRDLELQLQTTPGLALNVLPDDREPPCEALTHGGPQVLVLSISYDQAPLIKRLHEQYPGLGLVVLVNGRLVAGERALCLQLGADVVFDQCVTVPELVAAIRSLRRRLTPRQAGPEPTWGPAANAVRNAVSEGSALH